MGILTCLALVILYLILYKSNRTDWVSSASDRISCVLAYDRCTFNISGIDKYGICTGHSVVSYTAIEINVLSGLFIERLVLMPWGQTLVGIILIFNYVKRNSVYVWIWMCACGFVCVCARVHMCTNLWPNRKYGCFGLQRYSFSFLPCDTGYKWSVPMM